MIRKLTGGLLLVLVSSFATAKDLPMVKPAQEGFDAARLNLITQSMQRYVDAGQLAGAMTMVARHGKVVYFETVGNKGVDDKRPLAKDDLFRIYSMSKPITAAAVMQLYEQGKFQLTDPVSKFVPELKGVQVLQPDGTLAPVAAEMTMQQLLTHTTGLSYGFNAAGDPVDKQYADAKLWESKDLDAFAAKLKEVHAAAK